MKKSFINKVLALILTLSIVVSCGITSAMVPSSAVSGNAITSDDFEGYGSGVQLADRWESFFITDDLSDNYISNDIRLVADKGVDGGVALQNATVNNPIAVRKLFTTLKEEYTPAGVLGEYSLQYNCKEVFFDSHLAFIPYYNGNDDYFLIDFQPEENGILNIRDWYGLTKANFRLISKNTEEKLNYSKSEEAEYDPWLKYSFKYSYAFSGSTCILTIRLSVSNKYDSIEDYCVYELSGAAESFRVGFTAPSSSNYVENYIDNVNYVVKPYEEYANEFLVNHAEILSKTDFTEDDLSDCNAAINEYNSLPTKAKELLTAQKQKLDSIKAEIISIIPESSLLKLNSGYYELGWEDIRVNTPELDPTKATVLNPAQFVEKDGEEVYTANNSSMYKSPIASVPSKDIWPIKSLDKMEISFKVENDGWWDYNPALYPFILEDKQTGLAHYIGVQYTLSLTDNKLSMRGMVNSDYIMPSNRDHIWYEITELDTSDWLTISFTYGYDSYPEKLVIDYEITDVHGNSIEKSLIYELKMGLTLKNCNFKFGIGSSNGSNAEVYFKDLKTEFSIRNKDKAAEFLGKHEKVLGVTDIAQNEAQIKAMADEFFSYSSDVCNLIYNSGELDSLMALVKLSSLADGYDDFINTYGNILNKKKLSLADIDAVKAAIIDYNDCGSSILKLLLYKEKMIFDSFAKEFDIVRDDEDYSSFTHSFEDGINPFHSVTSEPTIHALNQIVTDPDDETGENKVLKIQGKDDIFVLKYWPTYGAVNKVSFTLKTNSHLFTKSQIFLGYEDENNYFSATYFSPMEGMNSVAGSSKVDGVGGGSQTNSVEIDITQKLKITIMFNESSATISATDENTVTTTWAVNYARGGAFGFGYRSSEGFAGNPMYIDDLLIEFHPTKGDFDANEVAKDIDIYYTSNTFLNPDDSFALTGNKLWKTVLDDVLIQKVEDADKQSLKDTANAITVVEQADHSSAGKNNSRWVSSAQYSFDEASAIKAELLQRSTLTMELVIPKSFEKGIYAIKMFPKADGGEEAYRYINLPVISFATGDHGEIATQGGTLRIIGNNLVPTGVAEDVSVRLINKASGENYNLPVASVYKDDAYSLSLNVPEDFPMGDYEVYVHNGYGDNSCWSLPSKITIGVSPKASWNLDENHWFNVKDYGAVGDGRTNDTPAVLKALQAASVDGGTVYFPEGTFRMLRTLAVPEFVCIAGAGKDKTSIVFSSTRWQFGEVPNAIISIIGNSEVRDMSIMGTRCGTIVKLHNRSGLVFYGNGEESDNVYFKNVLVRFTPSAGVISEAGGYGRPVDGISSLEVYNEIGKETWECKLDYRSGLQNLQMDNFELDFDPYFIFGGSAGRPSMRVRATHVQFRNSGWIGYSLCSSAYACIIEDCDLNNAGFNPSGHGFYMARNYLHDATGNNRELLTTDGRPAKQNVQAQFIGARPDLMLEAFGTSETDDTLFLLTETGKTSNNYYKGYTFVVTDGQGVGQSRIVEESGTVTITLNNKQVVRTYIRVNEPFQVAPNRRSKVSISEPRDGWFFVQNEFYEGGASGSYGMMLDAVWDGNEFHRHEGQYFFANGNSIWYLTQLRQKHYDANYILGEGFGATQDWAESVWHRRHSAMLSMQNIETAYGCLGFSVRECTFSEYGYTITPGQQAESISGFIMEHCTFSDRESVPVRFTTYYNDCGSLLFRDNNFETLEDFNYVQYPDVYTAVNKQGYLIMMIVNSGYQENVVKLGDVNLDGKITLKDSTIIRYYIAKLYVLTDEQFVRGDVNRDTKVNLRDVIIIRDWITNGYYEPEGGGGSSNPPSSSEDDADGPVINVTVPAYGNSNYPNDNFELDTSSGVSSNTSSNVSSNTSSNPSSNTSSSVSGNVTTGVESGWIDKDY